MIATLTIVSLLLAGLAGGTRVLSARWSSHIQDLNDRDSYSKMHQVLHRDVGGLLRVISTKTGEPEFVFSGRSSAVQFVSIEPAAPGNPGPYVLTYNTKTTANGKALVRLRQRYGLDRVLNSSDRQLDAVLLDGRKNYAFSYGVFTENGTRWRSNWGHRNKLPHLIRLAVTSVDTGLPLEAPVIVNIQATAERDCSDSKPRFCSLESNGELN